MSCVIKKYSVPFVLILVLLFFPLHSGQWKYGLALAASFLMMAFSGHVGMVVFSFDRKFLENSFFLKCCMGQVLLFMLWLLASPLIYLIKIKLDLHLNLTVLLAVLVGGMTFYKSSGRSFGVSLQFRDPAVTAFLFLAMICIFKAATYYSVAAGALGLDTHQHIYYANDLYEAGYLKVTARGTNFLDNYSKGLHALASMWAAPGFGLYMGPIVKTMPVLQALIAGFAFVEIAYQWLLVRRVGELPRWIWMALVLILCGYTMGFGSRLIYPIDDLNSTGRISSAAVMLLPVLAGLATSFAPSCRTIALNWLLLPLCGALAVKINPSLAVAYIGFTSVAWAFSAFNGVKGRAKWALAGLAAGVVSGLVIIISDPYYLGLAAAKLPALRDVLLRLGIVTLDRVEIPTSIQDGMFARFLHAVMQDVPTLGGHRVMNAIYPDSSLLLNPGGASAVRILALTSLLIWVLLICFRSHQERPLFASRRALMTFMAGLFAGCLVNVVLVKIASDTVGVDTHETRLLITYATRYESLLSMFLMQLLCVGSITAAIDSVLLFNGRLNEWQGTPPKWGGAVLCALLVLFSALLARMKITYLPAANTLGWWNPVKGKNIREFHRVEGMLPDDGLILAEALPVRLNEVEDWILPVGPGTAYLPFAKKEYAFNVQLGAGYKFSYKELFNGFCSGNVETALKFLKENKIKYIFSPYSSGMGRDAFLDRRYCKVTYRDLGIEYPAAFSGKYGIEFYKISESSK